MPKSKRVAKKSSKPSEAVANEEVNETEESVHVEEVEKVMSEKIENTESTVTQGEETLADELNEDVCETVQKCEDTIQTSVYLQYAGNEYAEDVIIENIKNAWAESANDVSEINTIEVYIKPEELCAYYVINGTEQGSVAL